MYVAVCTIQSYLILGSQEETIDRTVQLGRAFLCRKMDPSIVEPLCPESVLKQLSVASVQQVIQQETTKLQALEEKLTGKQKQASHQIKQLQIEMRYCWCPPTLTFKLQTEFSYNGNQRAALGQFCCVTLCPHTKW